ncbi:hypothetical protein GQ53DRAFT_761086 [Thozetella sp. PMI_491]|nr:hypothetical protein GQ53DRAFT_761086 [Thozetella sp. PMI_491]
MQLLFSVLALGAYVMAVPITANHSDSAWPPASSPPAGPPSLGTPPSGAPPTGPPAGPPAGAASAPPAAGGAWGPCSPPAYRCEGPNLIFVCNTAHAWEFSNNCPADTQCRDIPSGPHCVSPTGWRA